MRERVFDEYEVTFTCRVAISKADKEQFMEQFYPTIVDSVMSALCADSGCDFSLANEQLEVELLEDLK